MTRKFVTLKTIVLSALALWLATTAASACSCERNPTAAGILAQHTTVFTGIARGSVPSGPNASATTFEVTEAFKGVEAKANVVVRHPNGPSPTCGVQFEVGQSVTVAAAEGPAGLTTSLCSTWMFLPHVGLRDQLLAEMRTLRAAANPANALQEVAAQARGPDGWQLSALPDGRAVALGIGTVGGARHAIALACSAGKRPEFAIEPAGARTLLVENSDGVWAFPVNRPADALAAGLIERTDTRFKLAIDGKAFPGGSEAVDAFEAIGKDCEQRSGWQYGQDDDKQMIWIYRRQDDGSAPFLTFGKPATGWLLADFSCEPRNKVLVVRSTGLPRGVKNKQEVPFKLRAREQEFSVPARIQLFDGGDVPGFAVARFAKPQKLLAELLTADELSLNAKGAGLKIPARGAGALLPSLAQACGF